MEASAEPLQEFDVPLSRADYIYSIIATLISQAGRYALMEKMNKKELLNWGGLLVFPLTLTAGKISWYTQQQFPQIPIVQSGAFITLLGGTLIGKTLYSYDWLRAVQYGAIVGTSFIVAEQFSDRYLETTHYVKNIQRPSIYGTD